jgi:hypothetical protein
MGTQRAHIIIPPDLLAEIDALVGPRGRSAFLVETARAEVKRRRLLAFLESAEPVMRDADHPELASMGTQAWVKSRRGRWSSRREGVKERGRSNR